MLLCLLLLLQLLPILSLLSVLLVLLLLLLLPVLRINTDFTGSHGLLWKRLKFQQKIIANLSAELKETLSHSHRLINDDHQTHYYTGLTSYAVFDSLSDLLCSMISKNPNTSKGKLSVKDQLLMVLDWSSKQRFGI